ncbi:DMT family transporter [Parvularcula sp. LCG005]|uniref:DMT family transporter n=1 Tax=Parvularcula sp. LCG005 TaxID=3078805 RepID=UPI002943C2AC|nr:SMR family transporter [Parvularcula sp. LCG005]WOI53735.1 SMR family transporter [Parvularcula sp. LCG005]
MNAWILVGIAVIANISTNVSLKKFAASLPDRAAGESMLPALLSPWLWIGGLCGMILLGSYMLAIRTLDLSVSYAVVTSAALVGITLASMLFLDEALTFVKVVGVALVIVGILMITRTNGA